MFMRSYTSPRPLADEWDWQLSGTCRDTDPALFYDDTNERGSRRAKRESSAKLVCARCPVVQRCLVHAIQTDSRAVHPSRVGFVGSKAVGGAVARNRVRRRLRAQVATLLSAAPSGLDIVVRAQPAAAQADSPALAAELDRLLTVVRSRLRSTGRVES